MIYSQHTRKRSMGKVSFTLKPSNLEASATQNDQNTYSMCFHLFKSLTRLLEADKLQCVFQTPQSIYQAEQEVFKRLKLFTQKSQNSQRSFSSTQRRRNIFANDSFGSFNHSRVNQGLIWRFAFINIDRILKAQRKNRLLDSLYSIKNFKPFRIIKNSKFAHVEKDLACLMLKYEEGITRIQKLLTIKKKENFIQLKNAPNLRNYKLNPQQQKQVFRMLAILRILFFSQTHLGFIRLQQVSNSNPRFLKPAYIYRPSDITYKLFSMIMKLNRLFFMRKMQVFNSISDVSKTIVTKRISPIKYREADYSQTKGRFFSMEDDRRSRLKYRYAFEEKI